MSYAQISSQAQKKRQRQLLWLGALLVPGFILLAITFGAVDIPLKNIFMLNSETNQDKQIIFDIRLPRALLAASIGAILALCGAATQGLFRNPLADPSLIGVTAGASAGGSVAIAFGASYLTGFVSVSLISIGAFIGGMATVLLVYRFSTTSYGTSVATMLLVGIAITAVASSLTSFLSFISDDRMLRQISLWRMGGLERANYQYVLISIVVLMPVAFGLFKLHVALNVFLLGESEARHLGIDVNRTKRWLIFLVAIGVGVSVALAGTIAFVGLIVPHLVRILVGPNHRFLLPVSAFAGALLLLLSDILARMVLAPTELPIGLITAVVGAPIFLLLLKRRHEYGMQ